MTFIHRNDIQNLISSDTLSLTKSNIHSWCFHRHHHLIVGLFFFHSFSFVMLLNLLCRPSIRYHFFFRFFSFSFHFFFLFSAFFTTIFAVPLFPFPFCFPCLLIFTVPFSSLRSATFVIPLFSFSITCSLHFPFTLSSPCCYFISAAVVFWALGCLA